MVEFCNSKCKKKTEPCWWILLLLALVNKCTCQSHLIYHSSRLSDSEYKLFYLWSLALPSCPQPPSRCCWSRLSGWFPQPCCVWTDPVKASGPFQPAQPTPRHLLDVLGTTTRSPWPSGINTNSKEAIPSPLRPTIVSTAKCVLGW